MTDAPLVLPPALAVLPAGQLADVHAAYATPPRAYHSARHVNDVFDHYAAVAAGPGWRQPREVALAVLYHDAIYVAARKDNEALSAVMAAEAIARWIPDVDIDSARVVELIELTARHGRLSSDDIPHEASGEDTRHFLDCDMAILGAEPAAFDAYDRGIAAEYRGHVPAWLFKLNRRRFLKSLLARPRIYLSDFFHDRLDDRARRNLRRAVTEKR